jgi:inner membrane protein
MDNLSHTLFGLALARTGLKQVTPRATAALVIGANLPDIDLVTWMGGSFNYLKYHRGITHSIVGVLCEAWCIAGVLYFAPKRESKTGARARIIMLLVMALVGLTSHLLLDYINSYGVRPFLPFQGRWYAGDLVFIIDPWLLAILTVGLGSSSLFRMINQEIGAKTKGDCFSAATTVLLVGLFCSSKWISHQKAIHDLAQRTYATGTPVRVGALPRFLNPFAWYGLVETEKAYHQLFTGWRLLESDFDTRKVRTFYKSSEIQLITSATRSDQAKIFLDFARYPFFRITPMPEGYEVVARDLRFDFSTDTRRFLYTIEMDNNLRIVSEKLQF